MLTESKIVELVESPIEVEVEAPEIELVALVYREKAIVRRQDPEPVGIQSQLNQFT